MQTAEAVLANRGRLTTHDALLRQAWGTEHAADRQTPRGVGVDERMFVG
jgi:hypothetical protein